MTRGQSWGGLTNGHIAQCVAGGEAVPSAHWAQEEARSTWIYKTEGGEE